MLVYRDTKQGLADGWASGELGMSVTTASIDNDLYRRRRPRASGLDPEAVHRRGSDWFCSFTVEYDPVREGETPIGVDIGECHILAAHTLGSDESMLVSGKEAQYVRRKYRSLRDSRNGDYFRCTSCGYERHADLNAAANIGKREGEPCTA